MDIKQFDKSELEVVSVDPANPLMPEVANYRYPVSKKEAFAATYEHEPIWFIAGNEGITFMPSILPDNIARGMVMENTPFDAEKEGGGKDMFGVEWIYDAEVMGSMVMPGNPLIEDANELEEKLVWPDPSTWNWEENGKVNNGTYLSDKVFNTCMFLNGWYERLISFMDFEGAILALIDEDQKDAVKAFFEKLTDLYIDICDRIIDTYPEVHAFEIHDDWGSQKNTFFAPEVAEEMLVPYMRKLTDHLHSRGIYCMLHSCGSNMVQVPNYIKAGWDLWTPQPMNDIEEIYKLYGDKIIIASMPPEIAPDCPEEVQRKMAKDYFDTYSKPGKPSIINMYGRQSVQPFFREELYVISRKKYQEENE